MLDSASAAKSGGRHKKKKEGKWGKGSKGGRMGDRRGGGPHKEVMLRTSIKGEEATWGAWEGTAP
jgi:hypothetical protein